MRILVTGHAGFIGAHLCQRLVADGHEVIGRDLVAESPTLRVLGVSIPNSYPSEPWPPDVDCIIHLAGQSHIAAAQNTPLAAWRANVALAWECLEAYRQRHPTPRIVLAGSNHCRVRDVYGTSKEMVALLAECYRRSWGLRVTALIHVNAFGPADPYSSHLVTGAVLRCLEGKPPVLRSDGSAQKGYLPVADVVEAYRLCLFHDLPPRVVAAAPPISALALASRVARIAGVASEPELRYEDLSQTDYKEEWRTTPALVALGWRPRGLDAALADTLAWYRGHGGMAWCSPSS